MTLRNYQARLVTGTTAELAGTALASEEIAFDVDTGDMMVGPAAEGALAKRAGSDTYAPVRVLARRRFVALGDSIALGGASFGTTAGATWTAGAQSWATWTAFLSKQALQLVWNAGIGGDTSTQMLARFDTDVTAKGCDMVIIGGFTNDFSNGISVAASLANFQAMVVKARAAGIEPVYVTQCPRNADSTGNADGRVRSMAITDWCQRNGIRWVDGYTPVADPATGTYLSGTNVNNLHPNQAGALLIAQQIVTTLLAATPGKPAVWTPGSNLDPANLVVNGLMLTDVNADGVADSWSTGGSATTAVRSIGSDPGVVGGKIQNLAVTTGAASYRVNQGVTTGMVVGRRYAVVGRVKTSGVVAGSGNWFVQIVWQDGGGASQSPLYYPIGAGNTSDVSDGYFYHETTMPATATKMDVRLVMATGAGTVGITEVGIIDLTAAGATGVQPQV